MSIKNHSDLTSEITSDITNNGAQLITGLVLQQKLLDLGDSAVNMLGDTAILGKLGYNSLFTISSNGDITHKKYVDDAISTSTSGLYKDTGVFTFAGLTFNSGTTINIGAVTGQIVNNESNPASPTITNVTYAGATNVTVTTVGSGLGSYVMLDSSSTISFQNTFPTSAQRKAKIYLGKIGHPTGTITSAAIGNEPDFVLSPIAQLRGLYKAIGFVNNGVAASANGANLNFNISLGAITHYSINFVTDKTTPNEIAISAATPQSFLYRTQTGIGGGFVTAIDPTSYDVSGTITAIPGGGNTSTNQYIYCVPGLGFIVQYGQTTYTSLANAIAAVGKETLTIYPNLVNNAILIGVISLAKNATALNNTAQAQFFLSDKFGQIGGSTAGVSTATLQSAYNNSLVPQITVTDALTEVTFKTARASNSLNVFAIQNIAGSNTLTIDGNGTITNGTWNATTIGVTFGGSGLATVAAGSILGYNSLNTASAITSTSGTKVLQNSAGTVSWVTMGTFADNVFTLQDDGDATKQLQFQLSGITTGTTRTLTVPNVSDTLAVLNTAQTFNASQTIAAGSTLTVASNTDVATVLGRLKIDSPTTNVAYLGHFSHCTATDYGIGFTSAGQTALNTASGQSLLMLIGNSTKLSLNGTLLSATGISLQLANVTAPAAPSTAFKMYSNNIGAAGTAAAHIINENGAIIKLFTETGWTQMTGTATKGGGFDTATVTLAQLAQVVKALTDVLGFSSSKHGLIGT